jgi:hypothetical protein
VRRDDEDDRAGGESWIDHVVIPDDLSALDAEVRALRRERRARARRDRLRRLVSPRGVAGPLVIVVLLIVAGFASLLVLFQPRRLTISPAPLASPGVGTDERLPDLAVTQEDGTTTTLRAFRPAVLALAPVECRCDAALRDVGSSVLRRGVSFVLVDRTRPALPVGLDEPSTVRLVEPTGKLSTRYRAEQAGRRTPGGPVLVLVRADGRVARVLPEPMSPGAFAIELAVLGSGLGTPAPTR